MCCVYSGRGELERQAAPGPPCDGKDQGVWTAGAVCTHRPVHRGEREVGLEQQYIQLRGADKYQPPGTGVFSIVRFIRNHIPKVSAHLVSY